MRASSLSLAPAAAAAAAIADTDAGAGVRRFDPESDTMPDDAPAVAVGEMNASDAADLVAAAYAAEEPERTSLSSTLPSFSPPAQLRTDAAANEAAARRRLVAGAVLAVGIAVVLFAAFRLASPSGGGATSAVSPTTTPVGTALAALPATNDPSVAPPPSAAVALPAAVVPSAVAPSADPAHLVPPAVSVVKRVPGPLPASSKGKPIAKGDVCKGIFCE